MSEAVLEVCLNELIVDDRTITYGVVKPGPEDEAGIRFVRGGDICQGKIDLDNLRTITEDVSKSYSRTLLRGGELLVSLVGNPGEVAVAPQSLIGANIARQVGLIPLRKNVNAKFIMYYLMSPRGKAQLFMRTQGAVQQVINLADIKKIPVFLPSQPVQDSVVDILSSYDDLIENNKRRIELLEESARQLYKEWFVRFCFPGHEHVKIIDGVPEGWSKKSLSDLLEIKHGFAFKGEFFSDDPTPLILMTPGNFKIGGGIKLDKKKYYSEGAPIPEDYVLEENELLVTMTDLSKTSDTLGFPALVPKPNGQIFLHNQRLGKVSYKQNTYFPKYYFYHVFLDNRYRAFVVGSASGTAVKHTSPKKILSYEHLMPNNASSPLIEQFNEFAKGVYNQINTLLSWNENLVKARDLLLPKLMSGEIVV